MAPKDNSSFNCLLTILKRSAKTVGHGNKIVIGHCLSVQIVATFCIDRDK